jgi:plasmid stabilization system protein ParE
VNREVWSAHARADFDACLAFVAARGPKAAQSLSDAILAAVSGLRRANTGRLGRVEGTFKVVRRQPYIVLFELHDDELRIMRIVHAARDWPEGEMPPA